MLSNEQIEAIKKRVDAATKGPWKPSEREAENAAVYVPSPFLSDNPYAKVPGHEELMMLWPFHSAPQTREAEVLWYDTAEFIANARTDIPALLAEREELIKRIVKLEQTTG